MGNYKEHWTRKLCWVQVSDPILSQVPFWPKGTWHSSTNVSKLSFEQCWRPLKALGISILDRTFWASSVKALVLAGIQHPLFLFHFHTSFEHDTRSNLWRNKHSLEPSACRFSLDSFRVLVVCWVIVTPQSLLWYVYTDKQQYQRKIQAI